MVGTTPTVMTPQLPNEDAVAIATDFFHCESPSHASHMCIRLLRSSVSSIAGTHSA
jgi:hypothetical protein